MYLKRKRRKNAYHYVISESYQADDVWKHRELMDLGADPADFIIYPGGNAFYLHDTLEETLAAKGIEFSYDDLEALFVPFLKPEVRRIVETFQRPGTTQAAWKRLSKEELLARQGRLHDFDKRRLHYLRFGRVHIGNLEGRPWPFLNVLLEKSRDEIEHIIREMETILPPHEIRPYLYTALCIQTHFRHLLTRYQPAALDPKKVDEHVLEDLCRLNRDERFFVGVEDYEPETLHPYLVKYLILYFDHTFDPRLVWDEYVQDFVWRHRFSRPPGQSAGLSGIEKKACERLAILPKDFEKMDRRELVRCYRRRAKETHPDRGGKRETFVQVKEAFECLLRRKC